MIPRRLPAEGIHEAITMANPNCKLNIDDVHDYVTSILKAFPKDWLEQIYSGDKIVSQNDNESLSLTLSCGDTTLDASTVSVRNATDLLREAVSTIPKGEIHWKHVFNDISFEHRWTNVYKGLKAFHDSDLDFRLLHNILFCNDKLYLFKLVDSPLCTLCKNHNETVLHLFVDCKTVNLLWRDIIKKLQKICKINNNDKWRQITILGMELNYKRNETISIDFILNTFKKVVWTTRVSLLNGEKHINIQNFFHNSLRKKIDFLFHYFVKKKEISTFWELFTQGDVILNPLEDGSYEYKFDS